MNRLITMFGIACLSSGCMKYQYATVSSDLPLSDRKELISENDSVRVTYNFHGENGQIEAKIFNKLRMPVYIDWSKSSIIINDLRLSYWIDEAKITATSTTSTDFNSINPTLTKAGTINGSLLKNEMISFVPPNSFVINQSLSVKNDFFSQQSLHNNHQKAPPQTSSTFLSKKYSYAKENSPLPFRSFLTVSTSSLVSTPFYFDDQFWVSEVVESKIFPARQSSNQPQFLLKKINLFTKIVGFGAMAGFVVLSVAAATP